MYIYIYIYIHIYRADVRDQYEQYKNTNSYFVQQVSQLERDKRQLAAELSRTRAQLAAVTDTSLEDSSSVISRQKEREATAASLSASAHAAAAAANLHHELENQVTVLSSVHTS